MQPPPRRDGEATQYGTDLRGRKALPLGQQQNLAITWPEAAKGSVHERFLSVQRGLLRSSCRFERQPFLQREAAAA